MSRRITFLLSILLFGWGIAGLRAQIAPGQWRTHYSYAVTDRVAWAGNTIYAAADGKLFSYDPDSEELRQYNVLTGLHGNLIAFLSYNSPSRTLLIVYTDGNIDFLKGEDVTNLPDYKNKALTATKTVNACRMYGTHAYLSTDACLLDIDMERQEIANTYFFRNGGEYTALTDFAPAGDRYFLLTAAHVLLAGNVSDNLLDSRAWSEVPRADMPEPEQMVSWNGTLYVGSGRTLVRLTADNAWEPYATLEEEIASLKVEKDQLVIGYAGGRFEIRPSADASPLRLSLPSDSTVTADLSFDPYSPQLATASATEGIALWTLSESEGVYRLSDTGILPNGPGLNTAWKMYFCHDALYTVSGGRWGDRYFYTGGINRFADNEWTSPVPTAEEIEDTTHVRFRDIVNLAVDPADPDHLWASSWGEGLYEFNDGQFVQRYDYTNSPLVTALPTAPNPENFVRVDGACFDPDGNLWMVNSDPTTAQAAVHLLRPDGSWYSPAYTGFPSSAPSLDDILFTSRGQIWINSERHVYGIYVIDPNGTYDDSSDDRTRWISRFYDQDGKTLDLFTVHCITEDRDGTLWIGTTYGPLLYYHNSSLFDQLPTFTRIKVPRNDGTNEADYLLSTSRVQAIAVDGGNRKWIGTDNDGVYLLSADGMTTIHHFTSENSPLPSDNIFSVAVNPTDGEVFMGTENGLVSYRDYAIEGKTDYQQAYAFPNPVRPEFTGDITVTGLTEDSEVQITDIRGHLMAKGTSLGGQFVWNGCTPSGQRAASGVYPVFAIDAAGHKAVVCKIVFIK